MVNAESAVLLYWFVENKCSDVCSTARSPTYIFICILLQFDTATVKANKNNPGKQFSPIVFYGSPNGVPPKRPSSLLQLLHQIRVDLSEQNKLNSRYLCDPILPFDWCLSYTIIFSFLPYDLTLVLRF